MEQSRKRIPFKQLQDGKRFTFAYSYTGGKKRGRGYMTNNNRWVEQKDMSELVDPL
jgi:hypothetical protein